jgi:hypothetical protein
MYILFEDIGNDRWDQFCLKSATAWFRHTSTWIEYSLAMRPAGESMNCSFGITDNGELVAVAPLIKEAVRGQSGRSEFSFAGWNAPFPALADGLGEQHRDKTIKEVFREIERLAVLHKVAYAAFEVHPVHTLLNRDVYPCNPLPFLGFSSSEISTHIVPLDRDEATLLRSMRKGHKSDIVAGQKNGLTARLYDSGSITDDIFKVYRQIHFHAAGGQTRPERTWEIMYEWIQKGYAVLALLHHDSGMAIAAALTITYKDAAYYGSSCLEPEYNSERGGMHLLLWETMRYLKRKGIRWFETGWQFTPTLSQEVASKKEVNISLFKRGFGGMNLPYYRGEKFYHHEYMKETFINRLEKFNEAWLHE